MSATEEKPEQDAVEVVSGNWYKPGPSIQEFHQYAPPVLEGGYDVRVLIGGRASGKTTGLAVDVIGHCNAFAGAKFIGLRRTQVSNDDTSVRTFNDVYAMCGYRASLEEDTSLFRKWDDGLTVRIPSVSAVTAYNEFCSVRRTKAEIRTWIANEGDRLCSYILFRGMKDAQKTQGQLRGFECSYIAMIEADEMDENVVDLGVACFRWKDAYGKPFHRYRLVLDTNPPGPRHWIALTEKEVLKGKKPSWKYWHLRTEENKQNLAPGFIEGLENQYASKPAHRRRYLLGEYADLYNGEPVYHEFKEDVHKAENLPFPKGAYLVRGWDFGSTNTIVWGAYFKIDYDIGGKTVPVEYWWDLYERYAEMSDIDRQCADAIATTEREFPFYNDRDVCSGVLDFCFDPETEVLTSEGWKYIKDWAGQKVATLSKSGAVEFQDPTHFHTPQFNGDLYSHKTQRVNFSVTPGHKFPLRDYTDQVHIEEFPNEARIPVSAPNGGTGTLHEPTWAEFLGWWISDGTLGASDSDHRVQFTLKKPRKIEAVRKAIAALGFEAKERVDVAGCTVFYWVDWELSGQLKKLWKPKRLPPEFVDWDKPTLQALLRGLMEGDGHWDGVGQGQFNTTSYELAGQVQTVLLLLGMSGNVKVIREEGDQRSGYANNKTCYRVNVTSRRYVTVHRRLTERVPFNGTVYCLSVPNRTLYVRRNGCVMWSGNCDPAGAQRGDKGSSVEVMASYGLFPRYQTRVRSLDTTIAIYNRLLKMRDPFGRPCYQIDPVTCPRLTSALAGEYRYPFQGEGGYLTGEPIKGPAANGADHICFAPGTMVETNQGERPIESLVAGQLVRTREGYKPVVHAWQSSPSAVVRRYLLPNGRAIVATPDHPIWTPEGWIPIQKVHRGGEEFKSRVYALSVRDKHEFFANGILVANCDAARYPKINLMRLATKMMDDVTKANTGPLGQVRKLNPKKRWW